MDGLPDACFDAVVLASLAMLFSSVHGGPGGAAVLLCLCGGCAAADYTYDDAGNRTGETTTIPTGTSCVKWSMRRMAV